MFPAEQAITLTSCATINHVRDISLLLGRRKRFTVSEYASKRIDDIESHRTKSDRHCECGSCGFCSHDDRPRNLGHHQKRVRSDLEGSPQKFARARGAALSLRDSLSSNWHRLALAANSFDRVPRAAYLSSDLDAAVQSVLHLLPSHSNRLLVGLR